MWQDKLKFPNLSPPVAKKTTKKKLKQNNRFSSSQLLNFHKENISQRKVTNKYKEGIPKTNVYLIPGYYSMQVGKRKGTLNSTQLNSELKRIHKYWEGFSFLWYNYCLKKKRTFFTIYKTGQTTHLCRSFNNFISRQSKTYPNPFLLFILFFFYYLRIQAELKDI